MSENQTQETKTEGPITRVVLDKYDRAAVLAMLIRQIRYQNVIAEQEPIRAAATAAIDEAKTNITANREALKTFGFNQSGKELWEQVKEAIGKTAYYEAFDLAKQNHFDHNSESPFSETKVAAQQKITVVDKRPESVEGTVKSSEGQNIKSLVIEELKQLPEGAGVTSSFIKQFLEKDLGVKMHEKTVGMTLYRLSKDGLVRRNGRNWFYVHAAMTSTNVGIDKKEGAQVSVTSEPS